jgi:NAD(P)-dependent dehydrogenase (short-subunit alcohol dehydrogenase family)
MSKGALHRVVGVLAHEVAGTGVDVVNVSPGFVATERMVMDMAEFGFDASMGATPTSVGAVVAWLATDDHAAAHHGKTVAAQELGPELGLSA